MFKMTICLKEIFLSILIIICFFINTGCSYNYLNKKDYSLLKTPRETFDFIKKTIKYNDPKAFYYCLSKNTKKIITLSDIKLGWGVASSYFYIILSSKLEKVEIPPPEKIFKNNYNLAKITVKSNNIKINFLLIKENGKWKIIYPSPYPLPNISKLKKLERLGWRRDSKNYKNRDIIPKKKNIKRKKTFLFKNCRVYWRKN